MFCRPNYALREAYAALWPSADYTAVRLKLTMFYLRYARRKRIQWYRLILATEVSRSDSKHTLGLDLSIKTMARWHRWSITASFVLHMTSLLLPVLLFTTALVTVAMYQLRRESPLCLALHKSRGKRLL